MSKTTKELFQDYRIFAEDLLRNLTHCGMTRDGNCAICGANSHLFVDKLEELYQSALEEGKAIGREEKGKEKVDITDYIARLTDVVAESLKRLKVVEEGLVKHGILIPSK